MVLDMLKTLICQNCCSRFQNSLKMHRGPIVYSLLLQFVEGEREVNKGGYLIKESRFELKGSSMFQLKEVCGGKKKLKQTKIVSIYAVLDNERKTIFSDYYSLTTQVKEIFLLSNKGCILPDRRRFNHFELILFSFNFKLKWKLQVSQIYMKMKYLISYLITDKFM